MKTIAITNNKGGVGKTTTTLSLGAALVQLGYRVLLIDMDSQANLSYCFGVYTNTKVNVAAFMLKECAFADVVARRHGLDIISASIIQHDAEMKLSMKPNRESILKKRLEGIADQYDFVLIDCPPSLELMTKNAIFAADYFIVPLEPTTFSYQGLGSLIENINNFNDDGANIRLLGIIILKYHPNMRNALKHTIVDRLKEELHVNVFDTYIRVDSNLDKAQLDRTSIYQYDPKSNAAIDYMAITKEILNKI